MLPGAAATRSATSSCTSTTIRSGGRSPSRKAWSSGLVMLYGMLATTLNGSPAKKSRGCSDSASASISSKSSTAPSSRRSHDASRGSSSTAMTDAPAASSRRVSTPSPGPISTTRSPG